MVAKHPRTLVKALPQRNQLLHYKLTVFQAVIGVPRHGIMEAVCSHILIYLHDMFLSTGQLEHVLLSAPSVVVKNKAVNLTTVLHPSTVGTVTYYWWFDNKTEVSLVFSFTATQPIN